MRRESQNQRPSPKSASNSRVNAAQPSALLIIGSRWESVWSVRVVFCFQGKPIDIKSTEDFSTLEAAEVFRKHVVAALRDNGDVQALSSSVQEAWIHRSN